MISESQAPPANETTAVTVVEQKHKPPAGLPDVATYFKLRARVNKILISGRRKLDELGTIIYWETGRSIRAHVLQNGNRAKYGKQAILKLARDLKVSDDFLYHSLRFYEVYPIFAAPRKLTLTHYLALANVFDSKERRRFEVRAEKEKWTSRELEEKIKAGKKKAARSKISGEQISDLLEPKKGRPGIFRLIEHGGKLNIDRGFTSYTEIESGRAIHFKADELIRFGNDGRMEKAKDAKDSDLFTYETEIIRVVDGDTIWMKIWLKRPDWLKEKLRLRGVDSPELDTREGKAAKRFVEALAKKAVAVTITTTKPDKWDRYLSDVFLTMPGGAEIFLNNELLKKGHAVRKEKFSLNDWGE